MLSILRRMPVQAMPIKALLAILDQVLVSGSRFIAILLIGRYCGAEELGFYSLGFSALIMLIVVQESLVTTPYTMLYHRTRARRLRIATNSWRYCLIWSLGSAALLGLVALVANWQGQPQLYILFLAMLLSTPFVLQREFARRFSLAALKMKQALSLNVTAALFQVGLLVTLLSIGWLNAVTGMLALGFASLIAALQWFFQQRRLFLSPLQSTGRQWQRHWHMGRWLLAGQLVSVSSRWVVFWLLAWTVGTEATGIFAAGMSIIMLANPLILGTANILEPQVARAFAAGGLQALERVVWKVAAFLAAALSVFCLLIYLYGDELVVLLFNQPIYAGQKHLIFVLALSTAITALGLAPSFGFRPMQRTKLAFYLRSIDLLVIVMSFPLLSSYYGLPGAAYAMLLASVVGSAARALVFLRLVRR